VTSDLNTAENCLRVVLSYKALSIRLISVGRTLSARAVALKTSNKLLSGQLGLRSWKKVTKLVEELHGDPRKRGTFLLR